MSDVFTYSSIFTLISYWNLPLHDMCTWSSEAPTYSVLSVSSFYYDSTSDRCPITANLQQSTSVIQILRTLPCIFLLARNRRLKYFASVIDLTDDHEPLVTTCQMHLDCYSYLSQWLQPGLSRERYKNERNKGSGFTKRNRIHLSQHNLPLRTYNCIIQLYVFLVSMSWICVTRPLPVKKKDW